MATSKQADDSITTGAAIGVGIYSFPQAAQIVERNREVSRAQIRRWMTVVRPPTHDSDITTMIGFLDLIGLEMVCRFRDRGVSLQRIRRVLDAMRERFPGIQQPLAHESFYTDGHSVWVEFQSHAEEIVGNRKGQRTITSAIKTFTEEIQFVHGRAASWDVAQWIEINPRISFGAPVVAGTRIPVESIVASLAEDSPEDVARGFNLSVTRVKACAEFARQTA
ncbi:MAG: DUF433 domain-containing protein [Acidimicrobiaceae bacterium]|nr:DUF433 domain-containing protein [Acidimicrobiaceae bacterium]